MALHGISHAKIAKPIGNGFAKWTGGEHLLDSGTLKRMAGHILDHGILVQVQHRGSVFSAQAHVGEIGGSEKRIAWSGFITKWP